MGTVGIRAMDQALGYSDCDNNTVMCASLNGKRLLTPSEVMSCKLRIPMAHNLLVYLSSVLDWILVLAEGSINFDIKVISGDRNITFKLDCIYPCTSGDVPLGAQPVGEWVTISYL